MHSTEVALARASAVSAAVGVAVILVAVVEGCIACSRLSGSSECVQWDFGHVPQAAPDIRRVLVVKTSGAHQAECLLSTPMSSPVTVRLQE